MTKTNHVQIERSIARSRIMLSLAAILSIYIDPTTPNLTSWLLVSGGLFVIDTYALGVLVLHLLYALSVYVAVARSPLPTRRLSTVSTAADVLFGVAVAAVTEGATTPSYVFFSFAILAAGCRTGFRTILRVTAACVASYLGLIAISVNEGTAAYLMRPAYLAITGYLIAYLAEQRHNFEVRAREMETRAERQGIARALHDGYVQALAAVNLRLETCRKLLRVRRADDALGELTELQAGVRREYDDVRAFLRSLVDLERRETATRDVPDTRFTIRADFVGSGLIVENVLQIMLEAVRNTRRHADAASAAIAVRAFGDSVHVAIDDDGVGLGPDMPTPWTIASRVKDCGGKLRIAQPTPNGAHFVIEIPYA